MESPLLLAVDGTGLLARCSRAAARTGLTAPGGIPTGALTLFAGSLSAMTRGVQPTHLVIAWDGGDARAWRQSICPEYKENRPLHPDRRPVEGDQVREFCDAAEMSQWALDAFEADDLLAAASRLSARDMPGATVVVASDDKDMLQLAEPGRVWVRGLGSDGHLFSSGEIELTWGVPPGWLPRLRALAGDRSDGIPGLRGVGPAIALRMLTLSSGRWPLPEEILPPGPERDAVARWFDVMDLNDPVEFPEEDVNAGILDILETEWKRGNILPVLEKYGMRAMAERYTQGTFW